MAKRYKWLAGDRPVYGSGSYDLGGAWQAVEGPLDLVTRGYHVCTREQVSRWRGTSLWEVEVDGERIGDDAKECWRKVRFVRKLRWTRRDMVECAARDAAAANDAAYAASCADEAAASYAAAYAATAVVAAASCAAYAAAYASYAAAAYAAIAADAAAAADSAALFAADAERKRQTAWIEGRLGETLG